MNRLAVALLIILSSCSPSSPERQSGPGDDRGKIRFRTADGFLLEGTLFGSGDRAVILTHAFPTDQGSWRSFARRIDGDYRILTFNFRGYGDSQGRKDIELIDRDVEAAVRFMRTTHKAGKIVLVGASMGGTASLIAASRADVDGVAALSAPTTFRDLDAASVVALVGSSKLFMACTEDRDADDQASALFRASKDPSADLALLACNDHGEKILEGSRRNEANMQLDAFIAAASAD